MQDIKLSPRKLNIFNDCPRCFYYEVKLGIGRPRGAFPSLPGGMDRLLKRHYDNYRGKLPPEIDTKIPGKLFADMAKIKAMRFWKTGLCFTDKKTGAVLSGALDDLIIEGKLYSPLDYKTKGADPKTNGAEYYQTQLDCYALMLDANDMPASGHAYLIYYWPAEVYGNSQNLESITSIFVGGRAVHFGVTPFMIEASKTRAIDVFGRAVECLKLKKAPAASETCEFCKFINERTK